MAPQILDYYGSNNLKSTLLVREPKYGFRITARDTLEPPVDAPDLKESVCRFWDFLTSFRLKTILRTHKVQSRTSYYTRTMASSSWAEEKNTTTLSSTLFSHPKGDASPLVHCSWIRHSTNLLFGCLHGFAGTAA
jgi:hypothetical protein